MPYLGIDLGARRIGVAFSETGEIASPHCVLRNEGDVIARLESLAAERGVDSFVVGLPKRTLSTGGERKYREFAEALRQRTCKEVVLWDETLSTVEAYEQLKQAGRKRRDAQQEIDMHAAAVILQSYLDDQTRRTS